MKRVVARWISLLPLALLPSCALHFPEARQDRHKVKMARRAAPQVEPATVPVVLFADNLHTGLILELEWLERHGFRRPAGLEARRYVAFSWGDETAYVQERWLNPGQIFRALFWPSRSVMEIIPFDYNIPEVCVHQRLYQSFVPDSAGGRLADFLNRRGVPDVDGLPVTIADSSWGEGRMIRSPDSYYFPRICNIWTVDALNAAGFHLNGIAGLSADGVILQAMRRRNGFQKIWDPAWRMEEPEA